jgi:hypothetical protein
VPSAGRYEFFHVTHPESERRWYTAPGLRGR